MLTTGDKLRIFRRLFGYMQSDIGKMLGVTGATISSWELDKTEPTIKQLNQLAKIYECQLSDIAGDDIEEIRVDLTDWEKDKEFMHYAKVLFDMPKEYRKSVYDFIDFQNSSAQIEKNDTFTA